MEIKIGNHNGNLFTYYYFSEDFKPILLLPGLPYLPCKKSLSLILKDLGFNSILLHYRGSWGSSGKMFELSPQKEVESFLSLQGKEIIDAFSKKPFVIPKIEFAIGFSYGGLVSLLSSKLFKKVVSIAPPLNFPKEDLKDVLNHLKLFGEAFKIKEISQFEISLTEENFSNSLIIHGIYDDIVPLSQNMEIYKKYNAKLVRVEAGHYPSSQIVSLALKEIELFLTKP